MEEIVARWWKQAENDLESALYNLEGKRLDVAAFLAHQAVAKALKALRIKELKQNIKSHDLVLLARELHAPNNVVVKCSLLNPTYIDTRYPDYTEHIPAELYDEGDVKKFIEVAEVVLEWIKKRIES